MLSQSATYEEATRDYNWFKYTGTRGKEVSERTHKRMISEGDIFGVKSLKSGSRFTLIFPDMPHINFPLDKKNGNLILDRATKLRKLPDIAQRDGRAKARGVKTTERQLQRKNFDNARFAPRTVPNEYKNGIEFSNYQWRIVPTMNLTIQHTKGREVLQKNESIGMRYIRDAKGGVLINEKGMYLKLTPENYDKVISETLVMPIQDWPNGSLSDEDVKRYRADSKRLKHRTQMELREGARLEQRAEKLAQQLALQDAKRSEKENARAEQQRYDDMKEKIKRGEMEAPAPKVRAYDTDENAIPTVRLRNQIKTILHEEELLEEDDLDAQLAAEEIEEEANEVDDMFAPLEDILAARPFASDNDSIDNVLGSLFGGDDSDDIGDADFNLSDVDDEDPEDEEEAPPVSKVKRKGDKAKAEKAAPEETEEESDDENSDDEEESEEEETEDDSDDTDSEDDDSEEESDDEESDDEEEEDSEEDDEETEEEDADSEEEEDSEDDEEESDDSDDAADVDENSADEEEDEDVLNAEQEAAEIAKKKAAENKGTPEKLADPEPGDVVVFKADEKLKREWVVLKESTHKTSDSIIVYTLYDLTNSPDEVRQVRINTARKQSLFDIAEHVKDMKPTLFGRVYDMAEEFEVNKEPIVS